MPNDKTRFQSAYADCSTSLEKAVHASEAAIGKLAGWQGHWGAILHARVILNTLSMIKIIDTATEAPIGAQLLDHFSVAAIARTCMEAGLMMLYITDEKIDSNQFEMRRKIFLLNDTCHRSRVFKPAEKSQSKIKMMREMYRRKIEELRANLESDAEFQKLLERDRNFILEGGTYFIGGPRRAWRDAGLEVAEYDFYEAYFSGYLHSMPMSFIRAEMHEIDFTNISEFQYGLCGTALLVASETLDRTTSRIGDMLHPPYG